MSPSSPSAKASKQVLPGDLEYWHVLGFNVRIPEEWRFVEAVTGTEDKIDALIKNPGLAKTLRVASENSTLAYFGIDRIEPNQRRLLFYCDVEQPEYPDLNAKESREWTQGVAEELQRRDGWKLLDFSEVRIGGFVGHRIHHMSTKTERKVERWIYRVTVQDKSYYFIFMSNEGYGDVHEPLIEKLISSVEFLAQRQFLSAQ